jgi:PiT family inorganic phosphate transporter
LVGAGAEGIARAIGGLAGVLVDVVILLAIASYIYLRSRKTAVGVHNVNDEWTGTVAPDERQPAGV